MRKKHTLFFLFFIVKICFAQDTTRLSLLFAGDIMGHGSQITAAYNSTKGIYDYSSCFQYIKPFIENTDLAIGNLELTLAGPPYSGYPNFSSPDALAIALQQAGFDVLVTANNHSCDKGKKGIERTISVLDSLHFLHTGTFTNNTDRQNNYPLLLRKNGFKLALLNYTYGTNGIPIPSPTIVNRIDTVQIRADIKEAKSDLPDAIICFMHWGTEYQSLPNEYQKRLVQFLFRQGVSLVIGSHPHVLQPMELDTVANTVVVYSLGNFVSGQRDRYKNGGAMVRVELTKVSTKTYSECRINRADYLLHYVYRDTYKKYYVLPIFRNHDVLLLDTSSREAYKLFADDSRQLLGRYNKNVNELGSID